MRLRTLLLGLAVIAGCQTATPDEHVILLVRHAEKVDDSRDPELSEAGRARARRLAEMLADSGVEAVYSSDFIRTRETARPLADSLGLEVELYDPSDLEGFAAKLEAGPSRALVVGHSNTTGELVGFLGGEAGRPIEDDEYDRLYVVSIASDGEVATVLLRFAP
jgi:broad specificity phosphatase PhoE